MCPSCCIHPAIHDHPDNDVLSPYGTPATARGMPLVDQNRLPVPGGVLHVSGSACTAPVWQPTLQLWPSSSSRTSTWLAVPEPSCQLTSCVLVLRIRRNWKNASSARARRSLRRRACPCVRKFGRTRRDQEQRLRGPGRGVHQGLPRSQRRARRQRLLREAGRCDVEHSGTR